MKKCLCVWACCLSVLLRRRCQPQLPSAVSHNVYSQRTGGIICVPAVEDMSHEHHYRTCWHPHQLHTQRVDLKLSKDSLHSHAAHIFLVSHVAHTRLQNTSRVPRLVGLRATRPVVCLVCAAPVNHVCMCFSRQGLQKHFLFVVVRSIHVVNKQQSTIIYLLIHVNCLSLSSAGPPRPRRALLARAADPATSQVQCLFVTKQLVCDCSYTLSTRFVIFAPQSTCNYVGLAPPVHKVCKVCKVCNYAVLCAVPVKDRVHDARMSAP
jgi:hypothetical protein